MSKQVTEQEFNDRVPYYVAQAYLHTDTIFNKNLAEPNAEVSIMNRHNMQIGWETDYDTLRALWQEVDSEAGKRRYFGADIALEGSRLCLERGYWHSTAWVYKPPVGRDNWTNNPDSGHPGNLVTPVLEFNRPVEPDGLPNIRMGLYPDINEYSSVVSGRKDIAEITAESYLTAERPLLSRQEQTILDQGVHSLHAFKIENMLEMLRVIAR